VNHEPAFYLKGRPNGGGANSVVQEFTALVRNYGMGYLVLQQAHVAAFKASYGWDERLMARVLTSLDQLPEGVVPIATTNDSLSEIAKVWGGRSGSIFYYVQDYEPLFYPPMSVQHVVAIESYARVNDVVGVVKTNWLRNTLLRETFMPVAKIRPSLDRALYFPELSRDASGRRTLIAMVRPSTPRRAPQRTLALLNRLAEERVLDLDIVVFGATAQELEATNLRLHERIINIGRLSPMNVAPIIRQGHFFLDMSDYQAFGRSLAEAMACGLVPVSTKFGAPPEFIEHGRNGYLVTPSDLDATYSTIVEAAQMSEESYLEFSRGALTAVSDWTTDGTAADWMALVQDVAR